MDRNKLLRSDKQETRKKLAIEKQLAKEVMLLKAYDPDIELKQMIDNTLLENLDYLADEPAIDYKIIL